MGKDRRCQGNTIRAQRPGGSTWTRQVAALAVAIGSLGAVPAQAATLGEGELSAEVTAEVTPDRLPMRGYAPAALTVRGTVSSAEVGPLTEVKLRLDPRLRLAANTRGLATCAFAQVRSIAPAQARKRCGKALIGSGSVDLELAVEDIRGSTRQQVLLFNTRAAGRVLMYLYQPEALFIPVAAAIVSTGRISQHSLTLPIRSGGGATTAFRLRIGRTWRDRGQQRSYLVGRCAGRFANRLTLRLGRTTLAGTLTDPCRGR